MSPSSAAGIGVGSVNCEPTVSMPAATVAAAAATTRTARCLHGAGGR
ncbi:hypothetical protein [Mycolicibacterium boenickei]|nr:hypothetical protein [Mycolicibacterium boenickei]